jgi:hypothetical protein
MTDGCVPRNHADFNHLLSSINALSTEQMPQLRQRLDQMAEPPARPKPPPARPPGNAAKRAKAEPTPKKPLTPAEIDQHMRSVGLLSQLPDTAADYDDPDDEPIPITGEPLSEIVIRERR